MKFYTIGYGGRVPADFASLLVLHGVRSVADVRIHPDRASMGAYVKARTADKGIEKLLADRDIVYQSILELGNLFRDLDDWRPFYRRTVLSGLETFLLAASESLPQPFCLMCAEEARGGLPSTRDRRILGDDVGRQRRTHRMIVSLPGRP